jgi:hypothetical protein
VKPERKTAGEAGGVAVGQESGAKRPCQQLKTWPCEEESRICVDLWEVWLPAWQQLVEQMASSAIATAAAAARSSEGQTGKCIQLVEDSEEGDEQLRLHRQEQESQCEQQQQTMMQAVLAMMEALVAEAEVREV